MCTVGSSTLLLPVVLLFTFYVARKRSYSMELPCTRTSRLRVLPLLCRLEREATVAFLNYE